MKKNLMILSLIFLIILAALSSWPLFFQQQKENAAPEVFAGGVNAGCYIAAPNVCKIHVDPFSINVDEGGGFKLVEFQLLANGSIIYHFKTDNDTLYRPIGDYTPSLVTLDFSATCGETYGIKLLARDEGDAVLKDAANTEEFTCPSSVP
jgi:hypothetical protein